MPHYPDLADKVVLVTGAGSGIGVGIRGKGRNWDIPLLE
jgi:FlaA1/EpsC-like NDP-sugar epimerase